MKWTLLFLMTSLAVWAQKITVEFDGAVDFSKFKTFAIRGGNLASKNPALNSELTRKKINGLIEKNLNARGLLKVNPEAKSDINVRYRLGTMKRVEVEAYPAGWRGLGTRVVKSSLYGRHAGDRCPQSSDTVAGLARYRPGG